LIIQKRIVAMRGAGIHRSIRLSKLAISERLQHAPRILRFPEGDFIEVSAPKLNTVLKANRYHDSRVVQWQQNWPLSLAALILLLALLISGYQWGLPAAADKLAQNLPPTLEIAIGEQTMKLMDQDGLTASTLPAEHQARLRRLFAQLNQPNNEKTHYRLEFRNGELIGPNAFALPNGVIIMTDQLVRLAGNDQAILGVLGHELGHVQRRHFLRNLFQTVGVGVVFNLMLGDISSVLAVAPTILLDSKYSRDFEREADDYAIAMMQNNKLSLLPMVALFEALDAGRTKAADDSRPDGKVADEDEAGAEGEEGGQKDASEQRDDSGQPDPDSTPAAKRPTPENRPERAENYLSTHPSHAERIAKLRAASS
ncbi:MAG: hypothetical protein RL748_3472, partial [Pseudomonadota bacterium]